MEISIALKMRNTDELAARVAAGDVIAHEEMVERYYPLKSDCEAVVNWLSEQGLKTVMPISDSTLSVFASGIVSQVSQAFGVSFTKVTVDEKEYVSARDAPSLPSALAEQVLAINGLQPHIQARKHSAPLSPTTNNSPPYTPLEIVRAYNALGLSVNGQGQKIGIVIDAFPASSDLSNFWQRCGVNQSLNNIEQVQVVDGTLPRPSGEETLDVEWSSSTAPGAKVRIYATGDLSFSHIDRAYQQIVNDLPSQSGLRQISISLGLGETQWPSGQIQTDAQYFLSMAGSGVSVFISSGDGGSTPGGKYGDTSGPLQVSYPSSDASVTSVGGTTLYLETSTGAASSEYGWTLGGGGSSIFFNRPSWQLGSGVPSGSTRVVPDVSLVADGDNTPGLLVLDGLTYTTGGTSWSAPVWAGFCAMLNQSRSNAGLQPLGLLGPKIYPLIGSSNFRDITSGNNGFAAGPGFDRVTGIGVPNLTTLLQSIASGGGNGNQLPNLTPYRPSGWSDKVVVSNVTGTNTDSSGLQSTDNLYVDWALLNNGNAATAVTFYAQLFIDGNFFRTFIIDPPVGTNTARSVSDFLIGQLSAGTHTIKLKVDSSNDVSETNESDNEYSKTITVGSGSPDLTLSAPSGWSGKIVISNVTGTHADTPTLSSTDTLYLDFAILNAGAASAQTLFYTEVYVDNVLKVTFHTNPPLEVNNFTVAQDYSLGSLPPGTHSIRVKVDSTNAVAESNEGNNESTKTITVGNPAKANLTPYKPSGWSDKIVVSNVSGSSTDSADLKANEQLYVDWAVLNNGNADITANFITELYVDGVLKGSWTSPPPTNINYYRYVRDFNIGALAAGTHTLRIKGDSTNVVAETSEADNEFTKTITVAPAVAADFDRNGSSDILWQDRTSGQRYLWLMSGAQHAANVDLGGVAKEWDIAATGDLNKDGWVDILWQDRRTGQRYVWLMTSTQHTGNVDLGIVPTEWDIVGSGDFNGDGSVDILWQNRATGQRYIWLMTGVQHTGNVDLGTVPREWDIAGTGDFNGDGSVDILWQNRATGQRYIWLMTRTQHTGNVDLGIVSTDWDIAATGDYSLDGQVDILWQNRVTGQRYIWVMTRTQHTSNVDLGIVALQWDIAGSGDYRGEGPGNIFWQNSGSGQRYVWLMTGMQHTGNSDLGKVTTDWDIATVGDFNMDREFDILWQNRNTGQRYLWLMTGAQHTGNVDLGTVTIDWNIVAAGDVNGDGYTDIVWQNRNTGQRYLWLMTGAQHTGNVDLGTVSIDWDIVAAGDVNEDGYADIVWQNRNTGQRYIWLMTGTQHTDGIDLGVVTTDWDITGTADFNGDGQADILWQNRNSGQRYLWLMTGAQHTGNVDLGSVTTDWSIRNH